MREPRRFDNVLPEVVAEAERFLKRAAEYEAYMSSDRSAWEDAGPERAAVKRASMDLTRALAQLRRAYR